MPAEPLPLHRRALGASAVLGGACVLGVLAAGASRNPLPLALAVFAALVLLSIRVPELGLGALTFVVFTNAPSVLTESQALPSITEPLLLVLWGGVLWRALRGGDDPWPRASLGLAARLMGAYGLVLVASVLWASDVTAAVEGVTTYWRDLAAVFTVLVLVRTPRTLAAAVWGVVAAAGFLSAIALFQFATQTFHVDYWGFGRASVEQIVGRTDDWRISGAFDDPNVFAQVMLLAVPLALDRFLHARSAPARVAGLAVAGSAALTVLFTFSRGGLVGLVVVAVAVFVLNPPKPALVVAGAVILLAALVVTPPEYTARLAEVRESVPGLDGGSQDDPAIRGRTSEMIVGWQMFVDHPLLGVGYANYPVHYQEYSKYLGIDPRREERHAHSLALEIGSETGVLGLGVFAVVGWTAAAGVVRARRRLAAAGRDADRGLVDALGLALVAYAVTSLFLHAAYGRILWTLVALALAAPAAMAAAGPPAGRPAERDDRPALAPA